MQQCLNSGRTLLRCEAKSHEKDTTMMTIKLS